MKNQDGLDALERNATQTLSDICRDIEAVNDSETVIGSPEMFRSLDLHQGHPWTSLTDGSIPDANYYRCLGLFVRALRPTRAFEIGTGFGLGFGTILYSGRDSLRRFTTVDIDRYQENPTDEPIIGNATRSYWAILESPWAAENIFGTFLFPSLFVLDTQAPKQDSSWEWEALERRVPDASLDFLFIDGAHQGDAARNDLETFWPKVAPGGVVLVDDLHSVDLAPEHRVHPWCDEVWRGFHGFVSDHASEIQDFHVWGYPRVGPSVADQRPWGLMRKSS